MKYPVNKKYAWIGADKASIMLLNEFCWQNEMISWHDLLFLLEDKQSSCQPLKNIYGENINITTDNVIFATSKSMVKYQGSHNSSDERETEMMAVRWKNFEIYHRFFAQEQKVLSPCPK